MAAGTKSETACTVRLHRPFVAAPLDLLVDENLTLADRAVLLYLLSLASRPRWKIYVAEVQRTLRISDGGWKAARRRLEAAGYYKATRTRAPGGHWLWSIEITDTPFIFGDDGDPAVTIGHVMTDGAATGRAVADRRSSTYARFTNKKKQKQGAETAAAPSQEKHLTLSPLGIHCWSDGDLQTATQIESNHDSKLVADAIRQLQRGGLAPVPGRVMHEAERLEGERRAAAEEEADRQRRATAAAADAARRAAETPESQARVQSVIAEAKRKLGIT